MAISVALLAIPLVMLFAAGGGKKRRRLVPQPEEEELFGPEGLPLSDRMILNEDCSAMAVRVIKWQYDIRITNRYWQLREQGVDDPMVLTVEILRMDSPHCTWPPTAYASEWAHTIWGGTYYAVKNYYDLEQSGELWEYAEDPFLPHTYTYVKPLVPWA